MTLFEKIKSMTIEEMAEKIVSGECSIEFREMFCKNDCGLDDGCPHPEQCCKKWLESEI